MGYDCTLHLVDPESLPRFVRWFLEGEDAPAFQKAFDTAGLREEILAKARQDPAAGGQALLAALLMFCSAEAPHVSSRNFCVGLWDHLERNPGDVPDGLQDPGALSEALRPITERHPELARHVSTGIFQNHCVGHFVPAPKVKALREHVERSVEAASLLDEKPLEQLLEVLRAAESRGLAYWEATDIRVANGHPAWLKPLGKKKAAPKASGPAVLRTQLPDTLVMILFEHDRRLLVQTVPGPVQNHVVDLRTEPPTVRAFDAALRVGSATLAPDGRVLATGAFRATGEGHVYEVGLDDASLRPLPVLPTWREPSFIQTLHGKVLVHPSSPDAHTRQATPTWLPDQPVALPVKPAFHGYFGAPLADGSTLLIASGQCFKVRGSAAEPLALPPLSHNGRPGGASFADGTLLLALDVFPTRAHAPRLVALSRDGQPVPAPLVDTAAQVRSGPGDTAVITQLDPKEKDLFKVYWHESREVTSVPRSWIKGVKGLCLSAFYLPSPNQVAVTFGNEVVRIPWEAIAALPRTPAVMSP